MATNKVKDMEIELGLDLLHLLLNLLQSVPGNLLSS